MPRSSLCASGTQAVVSSHLHSVPGLLHGPHPPPSHPPHQPFPHLLLPPPHPMLVPPPSHQVSRKTERLSCTFVGPTVPSWSVCTAVHAASAAALRFRPATIESVAKPEGGTSLTSSSSSSDAFVRPSSEIKPASWERRRAISALSPNLMRAQRLVVVAEGQGLVLVSDALPVSHPAATEADPPARV